MNASLEARRLLNGILKLSEISDLEFLAKKTQEILMLNLDAMVEEQLDSDELEDLLDSAQALFVDERIELSAPDSALIAIWLLKTEGSVDEFGSRQVTTKLGKRRRVSNITKTMETLEERGCIAETRDSLASQGHKAFIMTPSGMRAAQTLVSNLANKVVSIAS